MLKKCSIIIPCYKTSFIDLEKDLFEIVKKWSDKSILLDFILIIDGGLSKMSEEFKSFNEIKNKFSNTKILLNKKRLGQQYSILNGFDFADSDIVITIDDDRKYPIENLCELAKKLFNSNYDCFIGKPKKKKFNFLRSLGTKIVRNIFNRVFKDKYDKIYFSSFRIIKKKTYKNILKKNYLLPVIGYMLIEETNNIVNFAYETNRYANKSRYNYLDLFIYFMNMNFFYTRLFYRIFLYSGVLVSIISIGLSIVYINNYFSREVYPGFTTTVLIQLFILQTILYVSSIILKYLSSLINMFKSLEFSKYKSYEELP